VNQQQCLPKYWTLPMLTNFTRHTLDSQSTEYKFVADKFNQSWTNYRNKFPTPVPAPASSSMPLRPLPPSPAVHIPSTNNHPPLSFQPGVLQRFRTNPRVQPPPLIPPLLGPFFHNQFIDLLLYIPMQVFQIN